MDNVINSLMSINFSRNEAQVYMYLLENPGMTVYQIAKDLNISRSSIYPIVEKMYEDGSLLLEAKDKELYYAEEPNALLNKLSSSHSKNVSHAKAVLNRVSKKSKRETYLNVVTYQALIAKAKTMMLEAKKEVYLNTDIDSEEFKEVFLSLLKSGVRVVFFSFRSIPHPIQGIEIYSHEYSLEESNRLMLVVDYENVLVGNINANRDEWLGTYTNNPLMVKIISEHIHHDIYLLKIKRKLGMNFFELHPDIFLGTMNEKEIVSKGNRNK